MLWNKISFSVVGVMLSSSAKLVLSFSRILSSSEVRQRATASENSLITLITFLISELFFPSKNFCKPSELPKEVNNSAELIKLNIWYVEVTSSIAFRKAHFFLLEKMRNNGIPMHAISIGYGKTAELIHDVYGKTVKRTYKLKAHDENNECQIGDKVEVMETRPLSKDKRWRVIRIVEKAIVK